METREIYDEMYHYDFSVRCRETFEQEITLQDEDGKAIDLTGKTAKAQVRKEPGSTKLVASMKCSIDKATGSINFMLTSAQTAAIAAGKYAYDVCIVETTSGEEIRKYLIGGLFMVLPSVTD